MESDASMAMNRSWQVKERIIHESHKSCAEGTQATVDNDVLLEGVGLRLVFIVHELGAVTR